jgi:hypothetical protein
VVLGNFRMALLLSDNGVAPLSSYTSRVQTVQSLPRDHKIELLERSRADTWLRNRELINTKDQTRTKLSMWRQLAVMYPNRVFYVSNPKYWRFMFKAGKTVATYILEWPGQMATCTILVTDKIFIADTEGTKPDVYVVSLLLPIGFIS